MATRRCFSNQVLESNAFRSLPDAAQSLYVHVNMASDDDGMVSSCRQIVATKRGWAAALNLLVEKRFLLKFGDIYVVKHWRISNSLKNDRQKFPAYPEIMKQIWIKPNRAYTDHYEPGAKNLYEVRTGIQLESNWNPNLTKPNLTELNLTELNLTEQKVLDSGFEKIWGEYPDERKGDRLRAEGSWRLAIHTEADAELAAQTLTKWLNSESWQKDNGRYIPFLANWIEKNYWRNPPAQKQSASSEPATGFQLTDDDAEYIRRMMWQGQNEEE